MKTIEERAKEYASKKGDISLSPVYNEALASIYEEGYMAGAKEQNRIDIDKACDCFCKTCAGQCKDTSHCDTLQKFRNELNAMEDEIWR